MPTKTKNIVWRQIVNLPNVIKALNWLKQNNKHYKNIIINEDVEIDYINSELKETINCHNNLSENSMLEFRDNSYDIESHFTIQELKSNNDQNAIDKYSMKNINSNIINERDKNLDYFCFPSLFPYGTG
jgi:hypothetical protein